MNPQDLRNELALLGVTPPNNSLRCCFYLQRISDAHDFFHKKLAQPVSAGGLGGGYDFVRPALQDPALLNQFCADLDYFLAPAVSHHLRQNGGPYQTFEAYYSHFFLNDNYDDNVSNFFQIYQVTANILDKMATNFRKNVKEACERILNDRLAIATVFLPPTTATLRNLSKIKSTGSDFHKGGKQVLLLTFSVQNRVSAGDSVSVEDSLLRLVYKPSDLEADCLIAGNSGVVNSYYNSRQVNFNCISLFEELNIAIDDAKGANPNLWLEHLPTYKILPIAYTSNQAAGLPVDVRRAYGYIEFLPHEHKPGTSVMGYYPWGTSDFKIFSSGDEAAICNRFYKIIGQLSAIAATFSMTDLHSGNVIVKDYTPYLIDLEISLTIPMNTIAATLLYGDSNFGGFVGWQNSPEAFYREMPNLLPLEIRRAYVPDEDNMPQNRLYRVSDGSLIQPANYARQICRSLRDMIDVISSAYVGGHLAAWIGRVSNVLVRSLPFGTDELRNILTRVASADHCLNAGWLATDVLQQRSAAFDDWNANQAADPRFLAMQNAFVITDLQNADIPIFYTRIGETNIVDSTGAVITCPATIDRLDNANQQVNTPFTLPPPPPNNRTTYYPASPFTNFVLNTQLQALTVAANTTARINQLVVNLLNEFGMANAATDVNNILA